MYTFGQKKFKIIYLVMKMQLLHISKNLLIFVDIWDKCVHILTLRIWSHCSEERPRTFSRKPPHHPSLCGSRVSLKHKQTNPLRWDIVRGSTKAIIF